MRERPILFGAPMVRANLDGRKTVTRRLLNPQPVVGRASWTPITADDGGWVLNHDGSWRYDGIRDGKRFPFAGPYKCPYGQPGDRLWVREAFALESCVDGMNEPPFNDGRPIKLRPDDDFDGTDPLWTQAHYRATDPAADLCCERPNCAQCRDHDMGPHWRPSIHMPRWASRITLEVTDVRVERLQSISDRDALAEGIERWGGPTSCEPYRDYTGVCRGWSAPSRSFQSLWESIHDDDSWNANPWVWVVEYKRLEQAHG